MQELFHIYFHFILQHILRSLEAEKQNTTEMLLTNIRTPLSIPAGIGDQDICNALVAASKTVVPGHNSDRFTIKEIEHFKQDIELYYARKQKESLKTIAEAIIKKLKERDRTLIILQTKKIMAETYGEGTPEFPLETTVKIIEEMMEMQNIVTITLVNREENIEFKFV